MTLKTLGTASLVLFGLIILAFVVTNGVAALREARAEAAFPPQGSFVEVDGRRLHYVQDGAGPDLVIIHGASGSTRDYTLGFIDALKDRYRVTVIDRPGMGYSDRTRAELGGIWNREAEGPSEQARLLAAATEKLGIEKPILMGHSFGGAVALAWTLNHDAAALVMVAGVSNPWPGDLNPLYPINASIAGAAVVVPAITAFASNERAAGITEVIFAPNAVPEGYNDRIGLRVPMARERLRANARQVNSLRPHVVEMAPKYGTLTLPTEIVHGAADTIVPAEVHSIPLSTQIPGANLVLLDGIGHMPHHSAQADVIAAIDRAADRAGLR